MKINTSRTWKESDILQEVKNVFIKETSRWKINFSMHKKFSFRKSRHQGAIYLTYESFIAHPYSWKGDILFFIFWRIKLFGLHHLQTVIILTIKGSWGKKKILQLVFTIYCSLRYLVDHCNFEWFILTKKKRGEKKDCWWDNWIKRVESKRKREFVLSKSTFFNSF